MKMGFDPCENCFMLDKEDDPCETCRVGRLENELAAAKANLRIDPEDLDQLSEMGEKLLASRKRLDEIMERLKTPAKG